MVTLLRSLLGAVRSFLRTQRDLVNDSQASRLLNRMHQKPQDQAESQDGARGFFPSLVVRVGGFGIRAISHQCFGPPTMLPMSRPIFS